MYTYKISRLEKIRENGQVKKLVIGVTCTNSETNQTAYTDWEAPISETGVTKQAVLSYIINYFTEDLIESGADGQPVTYKRVDNLKARTNLPVITRESDNSLTEEDKILNL